MHEQLDSNRHPGTLASGESPRPNLRAVRRCWMVAAVVLCLLSADAWAQTELRQCNRDIRSTHQIGSCVTTGVDIDHPVTAQLENITSTLTPSDHPQLTCYFKFWSFNGQFFPPDQLPETVTVEGGTSREATAWYICGGGGACPEDQHCPFDVEVYGIDTNSSTYLPEPFVEAIDPAGAIGDCDVRSDCNTAPDVDVSSITAMESVGGYEFIGWLGQPAGEPVLNAPGRNSFQVALYRDTEPDACTFDSFVSGQLTRPCRPLFPYEDLEILDMERPWTMELDRICLYVLNCPGCGPFGLCAPFGWNFHGEGVEGLQILLHDRLTGEILAKGEPADGGGQTVWFTPEKGDFSRYFLSFVPRRASAKAKPIHLKPSLDVSMRKP